jgi:hypothetical protein
MKISLIYGTVFASFLAALSASASTVPLDTTNYNFQLDGDGGGAQATLNGVPVEIFCDNFANTIWVPHDYSADVTPLSTTANLDETRFGGVTSWTTIDLTGSGATVTQDDAILNGTTALARYEMVAYLASLYDVGSGSDASNEKIQEAIWTLMDPTVSGTPSNPYGINPTADLEAAASWYTTMNTAANLSALNSFLANYEIVSAPNMTFQNGLGIGGFQEQIVDPPLAPTPEPRGAIWMLIGLFGVGGFLLEKARGKKHSPVA